VSDVSASDVGGMDPACSRRGWSGPSAPVCPRTEHSMRARVNTGHASFALAPFVELPPIVIVHCSPAAAAAAATPAGLSRNYFRRQL